MFGTFGYEVHICHMSYIHKKAYFNKGRTFSEGNIFKLKICDSKLSKKATF